MGEGRLERGNTTNADAFGVGMVAQHMLAED